MDPRVCPASRRMWWRLRLRLLLRMVAAAVVVVGWRGGRCPRVGVQSRDMPPPPLDRLASHRPWRTGPSPSSSFRPDPRRQPPTRRMNDYSTKFMEFDDVMADPRARIFTVDFKQRRRRPNQGRSVTSRLISLTVAAFCVQVWKPTITRWGMKLSDRILRGEELYRTVTPIFLHGGIFHLFTNMMSLQRVGNDVEKLFGPGRYLATYMAAGVAGNIVSAMQSPNPSLGASGAVFGVVGAYFVFLNRNEWLLGASGEAMTTSIGQTMASNLLLGFFMPQIDQWAHLGGLIGGGFMAYAFGPRLYLSDVPVGPTSTARVLIDRPVLRAPLYLESIPGNVGRKWQQLTNTFDAQVTNRFIPQQGNRPWQISPISGSRQKKELPTRSIKPGIVE